MDKEDVVCACVYMYICYIHIFHYICIMNVYMYNEILLSHKKERDNAICNNMDGPRDYPK